MAQLARESGTGADDISRERLREESPPSEGFEDSPYGRTRPSVPLLEERLAGGAIGNIDLAESCRELIRLADASSILENIPQLAMSICGARGAQLLKVAASGTVEVVKAHGLPLQASAEQIIRHARSTAGLSPTLGGDPQAVVKELAAKLAHAANEPVVAITIRAPASTMLLLVLERGSDAAFQAQQIRDLEIFGLFSSTELSRAHAAAELRASHSIETALVGAVHDAVIALDAHGIVRALSASAATLIGSRRNEAIGKRLCDLPGMAPLAVALGDCDRCPDTVKLACGAVVRLRLRRCEAGLAVSLLAVSGGTPESGEAHFSIGDLLGDSPLIQRARELANRVADSPLPILITGETGTGKEILAQAIHNASARSGQPFVGVNVSAIPRELLESELFGYEPGAFTGASAQGNPGKFELARMGTLLLDEVGDMPLEMQAKLLRVLQERVVHRLGGSRSSAFLGRVIASTNRDLEQDVAEGRFRLDLLHRLRVVKFELPPLRDRGSDVHLLVSHHLRLLARSTDRAAIRVAPQVMAALETYAWPGNVRELINLLECEVSLLPPGKNIIDVIPEVIERHMQCAPVGTKDCITLESADREACIRALQKTDSHVARAAQILGVAKSTLYCKIKRYGIG